MLPLLKGLTESTSPGKRSVVALPQLLLILFGLSALTLPVTADTPQRITYPAFGHAVQQTYFMDLLHQVLEITRDDYGSYKLIPYREVPVQGRVIVMVEQEQIDVLWTMTSPEREERLKPIRIPLTQGLLGYRIALVHEQHRNRFADVRSLSDLQQWRAVQGHDWPDRDILTANGLPVETAAHTQNMVDMVSHGHVDYFPRGAFEALIERTRFNERPIVIDPHIVLKYRAPIYFFVNANNEALAERLEAGLQRMVEDGHLERLIRTHPEMAGVFTGANLEERTVIKLDNPLLPEKTPLNKPQYWFDMDE